MMAPNMAIYTAGHPCRVIRKITEADRKLYFKDREFDEEAWEQVTGQER